MFRLLPCSLPNSTAVWDQVVNDLNDNAHTVANFDQAIKDFVACHATDQDRHELVQQLLHPTKPRDLGVQAFYYRLIELNGAVSLLPGTDAPLTDDQLKQAFYDGMPASWKERFVNSGSLFSQMTRAEIIRYFRNQEKQALLKQRDNEESQRRNSNKTKKRPFDETRKSKFNEPSDKSNDKQPSHDKKRPKGRITDDDPCPVHPGNSHKWATLHRRVWPNLSLY
jgi:hypothetical protein